MSFKYNAQLIFEVILLDKDKSHDTESQWNDMAQTEDRTYPDLHKLCYEKNVNGVTNLLKSVSDVNKKDPLGRTPLKRRKWRKKD